MDGMGLRTAFPPILSTSLYFSSKSHHQLHNCTGLRVQEPLQQVLQSLQPDMSLGGSVRSPFQRPPSFTQAPSSPHNHAMQRPNNALRSSGVLQPQLSDHHQKLEIIPNDDVTMVYVKGTDEKGLQRELPRILHQLGQEAEAGAQSEARARRPVQRRAEGAADTAQLHHTSQQDYQVRICGTSLISYQISDLTNISVLETFVSGEPRHKESSE